MAAVPCRYPLTTVWMVAALAFGSSAFGGQGMQFVPIRSTPWTSVCDGDGTTLCTVDSDCAGPGGPCNHLPPAVGTIGNILDDDCLDGSCDVDFNAVLGCWELQLPAGAGGVEVDLDLQVFGWGTAAGSPTLGAIQGTVNSAGYGSGVGVALNPKGWPDDPGHGAYQADRRCEGGGDLSPCTGPFDPTCDNAANGFCVHASNWVMPPCTGDLRAIATQNLDYAWATTMLSDCNVDDGQVKTFGGLILEVPVDAAGTYMIDFDRETNSSFMTVGNGVHIPGVVFTPACITLVCQTDADCNRDDGLSCTTDTCVDETSTCENIIAQDSCLIDDICYAHGQQDPTESCRLCDSNLSQTNWSGRSAGFACGEATDTDCDNRDTCDGAGACLDNFETIGTACDDPTDTDCDHADTCDGAGTCLANLEPNESTCTDEGNDCTRDFCAKGSCRHRPWDFGTRCGDATDTPCNGADTCDGSGNCLTNMPPSATPCGDPTDSDCDHADTCDGAGNCLNNVLPDDAPCPNGNFCDGAELCLAGVCQSADPPCDPIADLCDELDDECDLLGDFDGDLQVTQSDFSHWPDCETGPLGFPSPTGCEIFDFEQNGSVDLRDNARFQNVFTMP